MICYRKSGDDGFRLSADNYGNHKFCYRFYDGTSSYADNSDDTIILGKWHQIVLIFNGSNSFFYMDGVYQSGSIQSFSQIGSCDTSLYVGSNPDNHTWYAFNGTIDEVRIYNRALTPLEIWNNYQVMKPYIPLKEVPVAIV